MTSNAPETPVSNRLARLESAWRVLAVSAGIISMSAIIYAIYGVFIGRINMDDNAVLYVLCGIGLLHVLPMGAVDNLIRRAEKAEIAD